MARDEAQFLEAEEEVFDELEEDNGTGEEEFELIDVRELLDGDQKEEGVEGSELLEECGDGAGRGGPAELGSQCADCARCPAPRLTMLRSCGHRICGECMARSVWKQLKSGGEGGIGSQILCPVREGGAGRGVK